TFKRLHHASDPDFATGSYLHLCAGRDVAALFHSSRDSEAAGCGRFLFSPAKLFRSCFQNGAQARVSEIFQPKFKRVNGELMRKFVHGALAHEVVRSSGETTIRALP